MNKLPLVVLILIFVTLFGCAQQAQVQPFAPQPQPAAVAPPPTNEVPVSATEMAATPSKIAFVRSGTSDWDIFTADSDGNNIMNITNNPNRDLWPTWSPDGTRIAFQSSREWHGYPSIYVMDANGSNIKCLTPEKTACEFPAWSSDGSAIAYSTSKGSVSLSLLNQIALNLFVMDAKGNDKHSLAPTVSSESSQVCASWFPDNKRMAFASNSIGLWEICSITLDGSDSARYKICLEPNCGLQFPPPSDRFILLNSFPALAVSPDGESIAFDYRSQTGKRDIYLFSLDTSKAKCLTCGLAGNSYFPTWSPDGSRIAFTLESEGKTDIWTVNSDGSNPTLLIKDGMFPSWRKGE